MFWGIRVFFLNAYKSCGIPMPSEIIMPFSGFLVAEGKMNFWVVSFIGALANLAGLASRLLDRVERRAGVD